MSGTGDPLAEARAALATGQWQQARTLFERVLASETTPEALEGLGWALYWLDENEASFERREQAYRLYLRAGDNLRAARLATNLAADHADFGGFAVTAGWLQRARRLLEEERAESPEHGWLYLWEGHLARMVEHDLAKARACAASAARIGREHAVADLELLANALEGLVMVTEGDVAEGMKRLDESTAAALAGEMSDVDSVAQTCCLLVHACERVRDYDRASQWTERMQRFSKRWSTGSTLELCRVQHAAMLIGLGTWDEAERELDAAESILAARRPRLADEARLQRAELRRRQGRWEEAEEMFHRLTGHSDALVGRAAIALDRGDHAIAIEEIERFRRRPLAEKWVARAWSSQILIEACVRSGRIDEARAALEELRAVAERVGTDPIRALAAEGAAALAAADGDLDASRNGLEDAVQFWERARAPYEQSRARLALASVLHRMQRLDAARREVRLAAEALERLGAARDLQRARAMAGALAGPSKTAPTPLPLTAREIEVLRLVARGLSDKEVAAELRLSEHTVHRHVANILSKLAVPSRAAAVARLSQL